MIYFSKAFLQIERSCIACPQKPNSTSACTHQSFPFHEPILPILQDEIFEAGSCKVQSRHHNLVAFKFEIAHLKGSLKAASNSLADTVEIKLSVKSKPSNADGTEQAKPFLCIISRGPNTNMTHEIPIGRPLNPTGLYLITRGVFIGFSS